MTRYRQRQRVDRTEAVDAEIQADTPGISPGEILENQSRTTQVHTDKAGRLLTLYQEERPRRRHEIGQRVNPPHLYALTFLW